MSHAGTLHNEGGSPVHCHLNRRDMQTRSWRVSWTWNGSLTRSGVAGHFFESSLPSHTDRTVDSRRSSGALCPALWRRSARRHRRSHAEDDVRLSASSQYHTRGSCTDCCAAMPRWTLGTLRPETQELCVIKHRQIGEAVAQLCAPSVSALWLCTSATQSSHHLICR